MKVLHGKVDIIISPDPSGESVGQLLKEVQGLIVRTATKVTRPMIESAPRLEVISRTGGGLDNVDIEAATDVTSWCAASRVPRIVLSRSMP